MSATNVVVTVYGADGQEDTYEIVAEQATNIVTAKASGFTRTIIDGNDGTCLDIPLKDVTRVTVTFS